MRSLKKKYFILLICVATVVVAAVCKLPLLLRFQTRPPCVRVGERVKRETRREDEERDGGRSFSSSELSGQETSGFGSILWGWRLSHSAVDEGVEETVKLLPQKRKNVCVQEPVLRVVSLKKNFAKMRTIYRWQSTNVILSSVQWFKNLARCEENIKEPDTPSHYEVKESYPSDSSNHNFWRTEAWVRRLFGLRDPHRKFDLWCSDLLSLKHLLSAQACVQVLLFSIVFHFWLFNTDSFTNKIIKD